MVIPWKFSVKLWKTKHQTKHIFPSPPMMAFRSDTNWRDTLVRSQLHNANQRPGTTACGRSNCRTCTHITQDTEVFTTTCKFSVRQAFTCSSSYLIYLVRCTKCEMLYIGETCRQLNNRFGNIYAMLDTNITKKNTKLNILTLTFPDISIQMDTPRMIWYFWDFGLPMKMLQREIPQRNELF